MCNVCSNNYEYNNYYACYEKKKQTNFDIDNLDSNSDNKIESK